MKNKQQMLDEGLLLADKFCAANGLQVPSMHVETGTWDFSACAYYRPTRGIVIHVPSCAHIGTAGQSWSYPGYFIDRTPYGVLQHELGHHADWVRGGEKDPRKYFSDFGSKLRSDSGEVKLTNYCPNDAEWFAEMFRLFVTNSDLLKHIRPRTHRLLTEHFEPVVTAPWHEVLKQAPERTMMQCIKRGAKMEDDWA